MKIIKDNFNKKITCSHCKSVFTYNEKDVGTSWYHFTSAYGDWPKMKKLVKCPLCHKYTFLEEEN